MICQTGRRQEVVAMTTGEAAETGPSPKVRSRRETLDEQVRRLGVRPVESVDDMARDDVFESDEELDAFLAHVYAERHANLT
jgi:LmbE family N-acetylglucosaminyl deacetylase